MRRPNSTIFMLGLCAFGWQAAVGAARAEGSPFVGRWHWNQALSKLPANEPVPSDLMAEISRVETAHVRWSVTVTNAQGHSSVKSFDVPLNGEAYPISDDTTASFRLVGSALQAVFTGPSNQSDTLSCTLSEQRKRMTCNGKVVGEGGQTESYVDVYDRS